MFKIKTFSFVVFVLFISITSFSQEKKYEVATIAFYNLENLFDIQNDTTKNDEASPIMEMDSAVRPKVYKKKVKNMAKVIADIGVDVAKMPPAVIGVCEVENDDVLLDLVNHPRIRPYNYDIIHHESPDERGIDTGLLFQKRLFTPSNSVAHEVIIYKNNDPDDRNETRDVLVVSGKLRGEAFHFIVNHWPSRSGGQKRSEPGRVRAAEVTKKAIDSLQVIDPYAKIMVMGDFNDGPYNKSIAETIGAKFDKDEVGLKALFNPYEDIRKKGGGTIAYRGSWDIFDQIFFTEPLLIDEDKKEASSFKYYKAGIFSPTYLQNPRGRWKGYPFRSFSGGGFSGGYSDHFPVFVYLIRELEEEK